jgi:nitric oxide reductase large subunit
MVSEQMQKDCEDMKYRHGVMMGIMYKWIFTIISAAILICVGAIIVGAFLPNMPSATFRFHFIDAVFYISMAIVLIVLFRPKAKTGG